MTSGNWKPKPKLDVIIDIETVINPVEQADVEEYMKAYEPPKNYKTPEAVLRHREKTEKEAVDKLIQERRFSLGGKRMVAAGVGRVNGEGVFDIESWASDDLSVITRGLVTYLDGLGEDYRLIGWNIKGFDLPEVAKSFAKTKVKPKRKPSKWDVIDMCDYPFRRLSLKETAKALGIETCGLTGEDVAQMYADGDWERLKAYNEDDIRITGEVYLVASTIFTF